MDTPTPITVQHLSLGAFHSLAMTYPPTPRDGGHQLVLCAGAGHGIASLTLYHLDPVLHISVSA